MRSRGFSLLEVMVAVAILGLALTVILSAQAGLYSAGSHVANETTAIGLARCKMGEIEERLLRDGYQELDESDQGPCCEDQTPAGMSCAWKIERVELPQPTSFDEANPAGSSQLFATGTTGNGPGAMMGGPGSGLAGGAGGLLPNGAGAFGALFSAGANDAGLLRAAGGADGGFGALANMMGGATSQGVAGLAPLVMSIVYPTLKPMLEASIRKITLTVKWREGIQDRDLLVQLYVTNPMRGGLSQAAAAAAGVQGGLVPPGSTQGSGTSGGPSLIPGGLGR